MKRLLLIATALLALTTTGHVADRKRDLAPGASDAGPRDVLLVALEESNGDKSMHYQKMRHEHCSQFLKEYRQITGAGGTVTLTFEASPRVTGKVLAANCIRPDGTIEGDLP
jgi:hypothetical protein